MKAIAFATNGVYIKLGNFRRWDPKHIKDGKTGLAKGNKDEGLVWNVFATAPAKLAAVVAIRSTVESSTPEANALEGSDEPDIMEAEEGKVLTRFHRLRERNRSLVNAKQKAALQKHGRLQCEACDFDFVEAYGPAGDGIINAGGAPHQASPQLEAGRKDQAIGLGPTLRQSPSNHSLRAQMAER